MSKLIIQVGGGLVQDVFKKGLGVIEEVITVDFDVDDSLSDPGNIKIPFGKAGYIEADVQKMRVRRLPKDCDVDKIVKAYLKKRG